MYKSLLLRPTHEETWVYDTFQMIYSCNHVIFKVISWQVTKPGEAFSCYSPILQYDFACRFSVMLEDFFFCVYSHKRSPIMNKCLTIIGKENCISTYTFCSRCSNIDNQNYTLELNPIQVQQCDKCFEI